MKSTLTRFIELLEDMCVKRTITFDPNGETRIEIPSEVGDTGLFNRIIFDDGGVLKEWAAWES
jgi:hypothetical protein